MTDRTLCVFATDQLSGPEILERYDLHNVVSTVRATGTDHIVIAACSEEPPDFADQLIVRRSTPTRLEDTDAGWLETAVKDKCAAKQPPTMRTHLKILGIA